MKIKADNNVWDLNKNPYGNILLTINVDNNIRGLNKNFYIKIISKVNRYNDINFYKNHLKY